MIYENPYVLRGGCIRDNRRVEPVAEKRESGPIPLESAPRRLDLQDLFVQRKKWISKGRIWIGITWIRKMGRTAAAGSDEGQLAEGNLIIATPDTELGKFYGRSI